MITYEPEKGESIYLVAQKAVNIAYANHEEVEFAFNGIYLKVHYRSFADDIATIYNLKHELRRATR